MPKGILSLTGVGFHFFAVSPIILQCLMHCDQNFRYFRKSKFLLESGSLFKRNSGVVLTKRPGRLTWFSQSLKSALQCCVDMSCLSNVAYFSKCLCYFDQACCK